MVSETAFGTWRKSSHSGLESDCVEIAWQWRKSSYSGVQGDCVEIGHQWRKSTHSAVQGSCVEVQPTVEGIGIRDSKNPALGHLTVPHAAFTHLITTATTPA